MNARTHEFQVAWSKSRHYPVFMTLGIILLVLFGAALLVSATGFIRVVFFVSIGYAYSIALMAVILGVVFWPSLGLTSWIQLGLLVVYGLRLGTYILLRESKPSYKVELGDVKAREAGVSPLKRLPIWIGVSVLYVAMIMPAFAAVGVASLGMPALLDPAGITQSILVWAGLAVQALGLGMEALADWQKSRFKKQFPRQFCSTGLYRFVRCPNYLGEILVWVGSFVAGIAFTGTWWLWIPSSLGLVCIVLIMMGSTKRLEAKQEERYGSTAEYGQFIKTVPVLFPFVPLYSLKNVKVYLE